MIYCYRPQGKVMFSEACVILFTIGLMATLSLLILFMVWLVRILLECFLVYDYYWAVRYSILLELQFCSCLILGSKDLGRSTKDTRYYNRSTVRFFMLFSDIVQVFKQRRCTYSCWTSHSQKVLWKLEIPIDLFSNFLLLSSYSLVENDTQIEEILTSSVCIKAL